MYKKILFLFSLFFFSCFHIAYALQISEIMYNPEGSDDGQEWIEIFNDENRIINISELRFFEGDTNHKLKFIQGENTLIPQGYFVIVSNPEIFKNRWKNFSGTIFDSSFSLKNSGEYVAIKNKELNVLDEINYTESMGGNGNGNSLQKISGSWTESLPTPGLLNQKILAQKNAQTNLQKVVQKNKIKPTINPKIILAQGNLAKNISEPESLDNKNPETIKIDQNKAKNATKKLNFGIYIILLIFVLVFGAIAVYFLRKNRKKNSLADEFQILE